MKSFSRLAMLMLCLYGCAPKPIIKSYSAYPPLKEYEGFIIIEEHEAMNIEAQEIGQIKIGDPVFTINCDYRTVLDIATTEARKMGANCLKIMEHKLPNPLGSSCHRIKALAYRIQDITPYETEIDWHPQRKLRKADFKGSIENRPFDAATSSSIEYMYEGRIIDGNVVLKVRSIFSCMDSYFKDTPDDKKTLEHEQGHFDITEIYARRLIKAFAEEAMDVKDLQSKGEAIYRRIARDWQLRQDQFDSDIYTDPINQIIWLEKIRQDLQSLRAYETKEINIPFNAK